jgi:protein O-GlcNAc transferase
LFEVHARETIAATLSASQEPEPAAAMFAAGRAARQAGRLSEARAAFASAVVLAPGAAAAWGELAVVSQQLGDAAAAREAIARALALEPGNPDLGLAHGALMLEWGEATAAVEVLREVVTAAPALAAAWQRLGSALRAAERHAEAVEALERAVLLEPGRDAAHNALGACLEALGRLPEALASYQRAAAARPTNHQAQRNAGKLLGELGDLPAAMAAERRALSLQPGYALAHNDLGICHERLGELDAALACYRRALARDPGNAQVHNNLGNLHTARGEATPALEHLARAVELDPGLAEAHGNLAVALARLGEVERGHDCHRRAWELAGDRPQSLAGYALSCQKVCDWNTFARLLPRLEELARAEVAAGSLQPAVPPFAALSLPWPAELQAGLSRLASERIERAMSGLRRELGFTFDRAALAADPGRPLVIGYLSGDLRDHAIGHLMTPVFGLHDRERFRVHTYSLGPDDGSDYRRRIAADSDVFRDLRGESHATLARRIHADAVDVLIELHGHTDLHRLEVCALRPAPIVATFLGFPGCVGARFVDYAITDAVVTPPADADLYTEALVLLPGTCRVADGAQAVDPVPVTRAEQGLPEDGVVYCCFNGAYKIDPAVFGNWMKVLRAVPDSVLWLWSDVEVVRRNLRAAAAVAGIEPRRLVFAEKLPKARHLARLALADLFLDTRPYNAHTTACDALWAGVPVLTCPGDTFASRVGASLLLAAGLPELIASDLDAYVETAVRLGRDAEARAALRAEVVERRGSCALFDTRRWVRELERGIAAMWATYAAGGAIPPLTRVA